MTRSSRLGLLALIAAAATIWLLPSASSGRGTELRDVDTALKGATDRLGGAAGQAVAPTREALRSTKTKTQALAKKSAAQTAGTRQTATDPQTQPPLHGSNPHGQGTVAVADTNPRNDRPLSGDPDGSESGEEVVVGRARGEERADGSYHGHITILALLGQELAGVDTNPGETKNGPLQPIQTGVLDPLCNSTNQNVCLSVLTANSATTATGSTNDFAVARAKVAGLGVGAAESNGTISEDANCQTAVGTSRTANVVTTGGVVAQAASSVVTSKSCRGQAPQVTSEGNVINLFGAQVPIPAPGCANGTPDTVTGIPNVLPIVCNAQEIAGSAVVREALDVFVLSTGTNSLVKETTAAAEAVTVAPEQGAQCSDGVDNDGDGLVDAADPGCHTDGNANNPASFDPNDNSEADAPTGGSGDETAGRPECSDNRDNDGDGRVDERDPGCHTDGNPNNPDSYNPDDDDESDERRGGGGGGGGGDNAASLGGGDLPFTGANIVALMLAGLLMLAGGLLLRRREGARSA